jgi:hypothetical protein
MPVRSGQDRVRRIIDRCNAYRFVPRIRDLADRRLGTFEAASRYEELEPLIGRPINTGITGDYLWREPDAEADDFLPLRLIERLSSVAR